MATYRQIQESYAKLEKEAQKLRAAALKAIPQIRKQIERFGLTAEDLGFGASVKKTDPVPATAPAPKTGAKGKAAKKAAGMAKPAPKYQDPKSGATWSGMGKPPSWIREAKDRDAFLIAGGSGATAAAAKPQKAKASSKKVAKARAPAKAPAKGKAKAAPKKAGAVKAKPVKTTAKKASGTTAKPVAPSKKGEKKAVPAVPATLDAGTPS